MLAATPSTPLISARFTSPSSTNGWAAPVSRCWAKSSPAILYWDKVVEVEYEGPDGLRQELAYHANQGTQRRNLIDTLRQAKSPPANGSISARLEPFFHFHERAATLCLVHRHGSKHRQFLQCDQFDAAKTIP
jgi:hypothetical protein